MPQIEGNLYWSQAQRIDGTRNVADFDTLLFITLNGLNHVSGFLLSLTCLISVSDDTARCLGVAVARRLVVIATRRDAWLSVATVTTVSIRRSCSRSHAPIARTCRQQWHLIG